MQYIEAFDLIILRFIYQLELKIPFLRIVAQIITIFGDAGLFFITVVIVLLMYKETRKNALLAGLAILISAIITNLVLKNIIMRPRPFTKEEIAAYWLYAGMIKENSFSFPSGHSTISSAFCFGLLFSTKGIKRYFLILIPLLMGLSRMMLFVHYPTDVIAGIFVGFFGALLAFYLNKYLSNFKFYNSINSSDIYQIPATRKDSIC